jgi:hypothetical protein
VGERHWLRTAPLTGRPSHPLLLDLLEDALWCCPDNSLLRSAAAAAAPTWEVLHEWNLTAPTVDGGPSVGDRALLALVEQGDSASQYFVLNGAAIALAGLGQEFGALVWSSRSQSLADRSFLHRLTVEGRRTGFEVRVVGSEQRFDEARVPRDVAVSLACCPHGVPLDVVESARPEGPSATVPTWLGPAGQTYAFAAPTSTTSSSASRLLDTWAPEGWGYLRRGGTVAVAGTASQRRRDYDLYLLGVASLDRELALAYLAAVSEDVRSDHSEASVRVNSLALRLATSIATESSLEQGFAFGQRALSGLTATKERFDVLLDLANAHASLRRGDELDRAAQLCAEARALLGGDEVSEVRLLNLEALVAYHRGDNPQATALEVEALTLALAADSAGARGLVPTLRRNMARVLDRRLDDGPAAAALLQENATEATAAPGSRLSDLLTLACLLFDQARYREVIRTLELRGHESLDLEQEVVGYLLHIRSLTALGEHEQAQELLPALRTAMRLLGCDTSLSGG